MTPPPSPPTDDPNTQREQLSEQLSAPGGFSAMQTPAEGAALASIAVKPELQIFIRKITFDSNVCCSHGQEKVGREGLAAPTAASRVTWQCFITDRKANTCSELVPSQLLVYGPLTPIRRLGMWTDLLPPALLFAKSPIPPVSDATRVLLLYLQVQTAPVWSSSFVILNCIVRFGI
ncbi:hypothetical protein BaRGS_00007771 [Batillaria attramentaria]|uniref:Uncharacterized protein n=1 Tax=Batillaria attramentaria TaxID=370345 RepID=A0ABD0LN61_9CAEN